MNDIQQDTFKKNYTIQEIFYWITSIKCYDHYNDSDRSNRWYDYLSGVKLYNSLNRFNVQWLTMNLSLKVKHCKVVYSIVFTNDIMSCLFSDSII